MPADLVYGVIGISPETPCTILFVESLRDRFKHAYESVRVQLQKSAKWQKIGYDTGLKPRRFNLGDHVVRYHEPLVNIKLAYNWDGPYTIHEIVSESTVIIQSTHGRQYKSNVDRLRPWLGRELTTETYGVGLQLIEEVGEGVEIEPSKLKRGPGRPRKVKMESNKPQPKARKKKVSAGKGKKSRKTVVKTKQTMEKATPDTRSKELPREGVRRSPRLLAKDAVT